MATARESETDLGIASDDIENTLLCQPCEFVGEQRTVIGFCVDCREYLCQRCYDVHLIPSVTRRHVLLDKDHMPELEENDLKTESENKHTCQLHRDINIEYHCPAHSFLGCHLCFYQHQKSCKDAICIQEVCSTTDWSEEVSKFNQKLANISSRCTKLQVDIELNLQTVTSNHTDTITAIRDFKQEVVDMIEKLEKELIDKADKVQKEETEKMSELSQRVQTLATDAQKLSALIETLQNNEQTNNLYIELVKIKDKILRQEDQVETIESEKQIKKFMFQATSELAEFLKTPNGLGSLKSKTTIIEKMTLVQDITCKSVNDSRDCMISGLVLLSDQKLILTDWNNYNSTVKIIDMRQNDILSSLKLSSNAWGICRIIEQKVAVTLPYDKKVVLLRTIPSLKLEREIKVNGEPRGIGYQDGKLVVSYGHTPYKVEIMDMQGTVLNTFVKDSNGQYLFHSPYYLAINHSNKLIYVSNNNYYGNNVVCIKFDGTVVATYKHKELRSPMQVTFDSSGMVYVLGELSTNLHQITEDCKKVKVILSSSDGLNKPWSICYQENEEQFIIGQTTNSIKVYKRSYKNI